MRLNDWSFSQLCRMASVSKDTINRLSHKTAAKALEETLPRGEKPLQRLTTDNTVRSVHGVAYTRLWNADLLDAVRDAAPDFQPPQTAMDGRSTGLYCGEQDVFAFTLRHRRGFVVRIPEGHFRRLPLKERQRTISCQLGTERFHAYGRLPLHFRHRKSDIDNGFWSTT